MRRTALLALWCLIATACVSDEAAITEAAPQTTAADSVSDVAVAESLTTSPVTDAEAAQSDGCAPHAGEADSLEPALGQLRVNYVTNNSTELVKLIGDGPVHDPLLVPGDDGQFGSVAEWLEAARDIDDDLEILGYGPGYPFTFFVTRSNSVLEAKGIESLSITLQVWTGSSCEHRVTTIDPISAPDPCRFAEAAETPLESCQDTFAPRFGHVAVWTGTELLIQGGESGTTDGEPLRSGLAFDPATSTWRDLADAPRSLRTWPSVSAGWTGAEMVVVGQEFETGDIYVLRYNPADDTWAESVTFPATRYGTGAVVVTPQEVLLVGGSINDPRNDSWSYDLATGAWAELPQSPLRATEGAASVWTGTEAIFVGGYSTDQIVIFDPSTRQWREGASHPDGTINEHEMVWTGTEAIVTGGHLGPGHRRTIVRYDPSTDTWTVGASMPISPRERTPAVWTGEQMMFWSGFATYGTSALLDDGASYDPATDQWTTLPPSPLVARCQHSGTWTDAGFVVFGGLPRCGDPGVLAVGSAAIYDPATETWTELNR